MGRLKTRSVFICAECGGETPQWLGRCPECQAWNTLAERRAPAAAPPRPAGPGEAPRPITAVSSAAGRRLPTGIGEMDRILGGGLVPGAVVLIGGDPGIGKSTLLLQVMAALAGKGQRVLYASGEESAAQARLRAERVGAMSEHLYLATETDVDRIAAQARELRPACLVVDSIQMVSRADVAAAPGTISQLRESAQALVALAKGEGLPVFLIGHVTKDGAIAGPRSLEHLVDTVLYFEGERLGDYRLLRAVKNRFGSTNEIGVFAMTGAGLEEVADPGALFLGEGRGNEPGAAITCLLEGTRPLVVEVQALTAPAGGPGIPARKVSGPDPARVTMILAVLEKRLGLGLAQRDVFISALGGVRLDEPAADLGLAAAAVSSLKDRALAPEAAFLGEIGLSGEIRPVSAAAQRVGELAKRGFNRIFLPAAVSGLPAGARPVPCRRVGDFVKQLFEEQ